MKYVKEVTYYVYLNPVFVNFAVAGPFDCLTLSVCLYDSQSDPVCMSVCMTVSLTLSECLYVCLSDSVTLS